MADLLEAGFHQRQDPVTHCNDSEPSDTLVEHLRSPPGSVESACA